MTISAESRHVGKLVQPTVDRTVQPTLDQTAQPRGDHTAQPPGERPTFRTEANYVRVDVYPTAGGQPVLDLRRDDFQVFEDGIRQRLESFEHVLIRPAGPQAARQEPNTVAESRAMLENPHARVFVLFLDFYHVDVAGSHHIRKPLTDTLDRIIGQDDLVGVMTPEMSATDVTFARRTTTIEGILSRYWYWGERERIPGRDPEEDRYRQCYPGIGPTLACSDDDRGVAQAMIERRREKRTIDALEDLVVFLRGVREERKAVLAITDGWRLFGPDSSLERRLNCHVPTTPILIDPRTGKLTSHDPATRGIPTTLSDCDRDRMNLAHIDDAYQFRQILDEANRANTSFYPIDPRGLVVFDEPIVPPGGDLAGPPRPMVPLTIDAAHRTARLTSLRTLAEATDGIAIVDSNDLGGGLKRVVDDLTSYYLLGYYSTNPKLDGKFRRISVRVTRPGVQVRARRGYLAATQSEVEAAGRTAPAVRHTEPSVAAESDGRGVEAALASLREAGRDVPLRLQVAAGWRPDRNAGAWVVGEVPALEDWKAGGTIDLMLTSPSGAGATLSTAHVQLAPGARAFRTVLSPASGFIPGEYAVLARGRSAHAAAAAANDTVRFVLPAATGTPGAVLVRRGPSTGNRDVPTADARFRRSELLRVEVPAPMDGPVSARLLDRTGKTLGVPVPAGVRDDADGWRWSTAELALAPLAVGDYLVEISGTPGNVAGSPTGGGSHRVLVAFRVVP